MASDERIVYMDDDGNLEQILSPKSPVMAEAVFGSAPRPHRPSTPKSPPSTSSTTTTSKTTPTRKEKALPPVPAPASSKPQPRVNTKSTERARPLKRADSPDVETMIARTPRPRRKSSATFGSPILRARTNAGMAVPSSWKGLNAKEKEKGAGAGDNESVISDYGTLLKDDDSDFERQLEGEGSESDSSIDIHTPLPHLMFRDGLLSPRSKLLPAGTATLSLYMDDSPDGQRANSVLSVASTAASTVTKSGVYRDPRDTQRRRRRHKDQTLLRAGMGLTTGLGWSDSEDEDAPSLLTRRSTAVPRPLRLPQTAGIQASVSRSTSMSDSRPPVAGASKLPGTRPHTRTRTLSNPSRAPTSSVLPRPAASKMVPPRSVSASVMAPVRSRSISSIAASERGSVFSEAGTISDFPLPPSSPATPSASASSSPAPGFRGLRRPSVNTQISRSATASPITPPSASRVLNTVGTGPRPRIGVGMAYRSSGYSSFYEASRLSRASVASSSGKEVGVI
ncbi:hypothetical protein FKP32DRAFT_1561442 [Trametes sanguinea]|nr:hypothetical protein FKP32DRAFT_1561442 [Trametes sanguinea]